MQLKIPRFCSICFFFSLREHDTGVLEYNCDYSATSTVITSLPVSGQRIVGRSRQWLIDYESWHCESCWQKETNFCAKIPTTWSESFLQPTKSFPACRSSAVCKCCVYKQMISLPVSLFQQLSNQINEMHNLALLHAIRFLGKIMSLVTLSQWQPGKLFLCSDHLLAVLSAVSLIQSLEGLSFSACQAGSLLTPLAVKWAAVRMLCVSCGLFWVKYLFYVFTENGYSLLCSVICLLRINDSFIYW